MSVRVNLLPASTRAHGRAVRQRGILAASSLLLVLLLGGIWFWQGTRINDAEQRLADAERETALLRSQVTDLALFGDLRDEVNRLDGAVADTLAYEVTVAGLLQDLAASVAENAQVDNLNVTLLDEPERDPITGQLAIGTFTMSVQALSVHAPGVERFLLGLDQQLSFFDVHVSTSTIDAEREDELDVVTFSVDGRLSEVLLTRRYALGVPGVER